MLANEEIKRLLAEIAISQSEEAYKELFLLTHERLSSFAYSILRSRYDAEEVVSDVFIRIWEKRADLTEIESPAFYFFTAVKNGCLTRLQKQRKQREIAPESWSAQLSSIYFDPEKLMMTEEMLRHIKMVINDLPPRCRLVFKLVKEEGLKYREVAELLQISIKTVENQMAIAFKRIGKCMHLDIAKQASEQ